MKTRAHLLLGAMCCCVGALQAEEGNDIEPSPTVVEQRAPISDTLITWINFSNSNAESDRPGFEYDGNIRNTAIGLEWSHLRWALGAMFSYSEAAFDTPGSQDERNERKTSLTPYVTWKPLPGIHLRAFAGASEGDFNRRRSVSSATFPASFSGDTNTRGMSAGLTALAFAPIGSGLLSGSLSVVRDRTRFDDFVEQSSDPVNYAPVFNPVFTQRITTVSAQGRYLASFGKFTPYVSLGWFEHTAGNLDEADSSGWTWGGGLGYMLGNRARIALQYMQLEDKRFEESRTFSGQLLVFF